MALLQKVHSASVGSGDGVINEGERIWHLSWSPNGAFLCSCGEDKIIRIWQCININAWLSESQNTIANVDTASNTPSIRCIATLEDAQTRTLRCCEWNPDGRMIACASFDGTVVVWEAQGGSMSRWEQIANLEGHENEVKSVAWSHDGKWLATCGRDKRVWVWEQLPNSNEFECASMLDGHTQDVKFIKWHPTENLLFSASYDDTIKLWAEDSDEFYCIATLTGHSSTVWGIAIDPCSDGRQFVSCSADFCIMLWQCDGPVLGNSRGQWRAIHSLKGAHTDFPIYTLDWSSSHGHISSGGGDNSVSLCKITSNDDSSSVIDLISVSKEAHMGDVNCVRWNPCASKSSLLATAGDDGFINFFKLVIL